MQLPLDTVRHLAALQNYAKQFDFETKMAEKPVKPLVAQAARLQCDFEANNEKVVGANVAVAAAAAAASSTYTSTSSSCSSSFALLLLFFCFNRKCCLQR